MNRRTLGRGLDALIQNTVLAQEEALLRITEARAEADLRPTDLPPGPLPQGKGNEANPSELHLIAIDRITPGRFQPRRFFDETALAELAEAFKAQGIIEPLIARPSTDGFELIAGERRLRAAGI